MVIATKQCEYAGARSHPCFSGDDIFALEAAARNARGNVIYEQDPEGGIRLREYDARDNLLRETIVVGQIDSPANGDNDQGILLAHSTYNSYGDVTSTTPAAGRTTWFDYDLDGRRVGSWYFDGTDQILDVTHHDESGRATGARRLVLPQGQQVTSGLAAVDFKAAAYTQYTLWSTGTQYNAAGQVTRSTDQFGNAHETTYDLRGQQIQTRTETRCVSEEPAWLVSRTFYDPKGRAVVTGDSFVEDAAVTAANAAAFNPVTQTYSSFSFDNTIATTASFSVYDGAGRVVKTYRLKDVTIAIVTTAAGAATVQKTELRVGEDTFVAPTEAAPNGALYEDICFRSSRVL